MKMTGYTLLILMASLLGSLTAQAVYVPYGVTSGANKQRIERALLVGGTSACTITSQSGTWIASATGISDGSECVLTLTSGTFSAGLTCTCSSNTLSGYMCDAQINSQGSITTRIIDYNGVPVGNIAINLICMGTR